MKITHASPQAPFHSHSFPQGLRTRTISNVSVLLPRFTSNYYLKHVNTLDITSFYFISLSPILLSVQPHEIVLKIHCQLYMINSYRLINT